MKVTNREFDAKIAIAISDEVPTVLGRFEALDLFKAEFLNGKEFVIE